MTTSDSECQITDLDELVAVEDAFAPGGVEIGERLFRDGFLGGFSRAAAKSSASFVEMPK